MPNQNPEQLARDQTDKQLTACGWTIQSIKKVNLHVGIGVAVKEYLTDVGPADYVSFVDGKPSGVIEAKREEQGRKFNEHVNQADIYAKAKLKHLNNEPLPFVYISTEEIQDLLTLEILNQEPGKYSVFIGVHVFLQRLTLLKYLSHWN